MDVKYFCQQINIYQYNVLVFTAPILWEKNILYDIDSHRYTTKLLIHYSVSWVIFSMLRSGELRQL